MRASRVVMIVSKFFPAVGGTENQALLLCEHLMQQGISVEVLTRRVQGLPDREQVRGVAVSRAIRVLDRGKLFGVTYFVSCLTWLIVHRRDYDIIHCHILHGFHSLAAVCMRYLFGKKVIIKVASTGLLSDFTVLKNTLFGPSMLGFLRNADRIIALCREAVAEARENGFQSKKIVVIPNGVDTARFKPARLQAGVPKRIVYAGSLTATKGVDVLIDAFFMLKREQTDLVLDIFGSGSLHDSLRDKAVSLGLAGDVIFHGSVPDIERRLSSACIFVQPSLVEGMSNVILEAMAAGLPVVATTTGAAPDIIQDGVNGLLVNPGSVEQMYAAVARVLSDEALAESIGRKARASIEASYSIETVVNTYVELYHQLLKPAAGGCGRESMV
jgi:L-malate glycosyltransferase